MRGAFQVLLTTEDRPVLNMPTAATLPIREPVAAALTYSPYGGGIKIYSGFL